jgi:hypothetical protein
MHKDGRWTPEEIADRLDATVGQEKMPLLEVMERLQRDREAAAS